MSEKFGFRDVKRDVFRRIRSNEWGPGSLLPGEVELATLFGCARATSSRRQAYQSHTSCGLA